MKKIIVLGLYQNLDIYVKTKISFDLIVEYPFDNPNNESYFPRVLESGELYNSEKIHTIDYEHMI